MRNRILALELAALVALAACDPIGEGQVSAQSTDRLCQYYASEVGALRGRPDAVSAELERRGAIRPDEWDDLVGLHVHYGMNKCATEILGGAPTVDAHSRVGAVEVETLVYPSGASFTLTNGRVTSYALPGGVLSRQ
jgi:hypothetical protein